MDLAKLVNTILGREAESDDRVAATQPITFYASSQGKTREDASRKLLGALPAPVGSAIYLTPPKLDIQRHGKNVWHGNASYQLKDDSVPPTDEAAPTLKQTGHYQARAARRAPRVVPTHQQTGRNQERAVGRAPGAVPASGTGYSPSALEQQVQQGHTYRR